MLRCYSVYYRNIVFKFHFLSDRVNPWKYTGVRFLFFVNLVLSICLIEDQLMGKNAVYSNLEKNMPGGRIIDV